MLAFSASHPAHCCVLHMYYTGPHRHAACELPDHSCNNAVACLSSIRSASGSFPHAPTPRPCREGRQDEDALDLDIHWQRCYNEDFGHMPQLSQVIITEAEAA